MAFQIQDDILNISKNSALADLKGWGEDIHEGKRTIMVLHSLKNASKPSLTCSPREGLSSATDFD